MNYGFDISLFAGSVKDENIRSLVFGDYMSEERFVRRGGLAGGPGGIAPTNS